MRPHLVVPLCVAAACAVWGGPVDFGKKEFASALAERNIPAGRFRIQAEVSTGAPESFKISGVRISGGDLRGLMYGLLEAAEQIRSTGRLAPASGSAAFPVRGVRFAVQVRHLEEGWFHSRDYWEELAAMLARSRLNRLNLVFEQSVIFTGRLHQTLRLLSDIASAYGVDLAISLRPESLGPGGGELKALLSGAPAVRSVQVAGSSAGRLDLIRAIGEAGRMVTAEVPHADLTPPILKELAETGVPWVMAAAYEGNAPPALNGAKALIWRLTPGDAEAEWSGPVFVRKTLQSLSGPGVGGFEIDAPVRSSPSADRLFYLHWGRLGYDPKTPDKAWAGKDVK
ncbi:MAG: hypothetical protein IT159_11230 [Bryobacterales bacterium]|nr:hypothetical protein [Bryobacterales bacterium]